MVLVCYEKRGNGSSKSGYEDKRREKKRKTKKEMDVYD